MFEVLLNGEPISDKKNENIFETKEGAIVFAYNWCGSGLLPNDWDGSVVNIAGVFENARLIKVHELPTVVKLYEVFVDAGEYWEFYLNEADVPDDRMKEYGIASIQNALKIDDKYYLLHPETVDPITYIGRDGPAPTKAELDKKLREEALSLLSPEHKRVLGVQ